MAQKTCEDLHASGSPLLGPHLAPFTRLSLYFLPRPVLTHSLTHDFPKSCVRPCTPIVPLAGKSPSFGSQSKRRTSGDHHTTLT